MASESSVVPEPEWFSPDDAAAWMRRQRWFAGKSRSGTASLRAIAELPRCEPPTTLFCAEVAYDDGSIERYDLPLIVRPGRPDQVADALADPNTAMAWLHGIAANDTSGPLTFTLTAQASEIPVNGVAAPMSAQQSNTSIVVGQSAVLKVYRRLEPGLNPDIEIHDALTRAGGRNTARLLGHASVTIDGETFSLAMLQEYLPNAKDGWDIATASVRAHTDFASNAYDLGAATAAVHADLARAFGTSTLSARGLSARADDMDAQLDAALLEVPQLAELEKSLRRNIDALRTVDTLPVQRIHGDLHLGQVLSTLDRWMVLDFEGEPAKTLAERRAPDSPLRDVAGMLRSFDYAANHDVVDTAGSVAAAGTPGDRSQWAQGCRDAFCAGYAEASGIDLAQFAVALRAFESDKAVYETVYETRSRPTWLPIPLASLHRLAHLEA